MKAATEPDCERLLTFVLEIEEYVDLSGMRPGLNGQIAYDYLELGLTGHT